LPALYSFVQVCLCDRWRVQQLTHQLAANPEQFLPLCRALDLGPSAFARRLLAHGSYGQHCDEKGHQKTARKQGHPNSLLARIKPIIRTYKIHTHIIIHTREKCQTAIQNNFATFQIHGKTLAFFRTWGQTKCCLLNYGETVVMRLSRSQGIVDTRT